MNYKKIASLTVASVIVTTSTNIQLLPVFAQDKVSTVNVEMMNQEIYITLENGTKININGKDTARGTNMLIAYTTAWGKPTSGQNEWGVEIVVDANGVVTKRTDPGSKVDENIIVEDGFVLSAHGTARDLLAGIKVGDKISSVGIIPIKLEETKTELTNENLSTGIKYKELKVENFAGQENNTQRVNIIEADLNNDNVGIITSKALDSVVAKETLPQQAKREVYKGHNVVGGINADMFNSSTGINMTMQVQDKSLLINHSYDSHVDIYPVFAVQDNGKAFIDKLEITGEFKSNGQTVKINSLNRNEHLDNKIGLYTNKLNQNKTFTVGSYTGTSTVAVIEGVSGANNIKASNTYTGKVKLITDNLQNIKLEDDEVVIAGFGDKSATIKENLKPGSIVSFEWNLKKGDSKTTVNNIAHATGGFNWLVQDGKAWSKSELEKVYGASMVSGKNARSAIGITAEGKVIAVTVDKESAKFADSKGVTLYEMAKIMKENGAVNAIGLDGGGSTEMVASLQGSTSLQTVNHPSDGSSRAVTNAILFVNGSSKTAQIGEIKVDKDITIFEGATYKFRTRVTDTNGNPYNLGNKKISYNTDMGTIDSEGNFTAQKVGQGEVVASVDGVSGSAKVNVIDSIDNFYFTQEGPVGLNQGESKEFSVKATKDNKDVILSASAIEWNVDASIGSFDKNGVLTINENVANDTLATVTAKIGNIEKKIDIIIGLQDVVIDNFESGDISNYATNKTYVSSYDIEVSNEQSKSGANSLKLTYDYTGWTQGNGAMYITPKEKPQVAIKPKALGMWVYGDKKAPWLRGQLITADGSKKTVDFAKKVDWEGWKYVEIPVDQSWNAPMSLNYIYAVETDKSLQGTNYGGAIYIDDIQWVYTEGKDLIGPEFTSTYPASNNIYTDNVKFSTVVTDDKSGVNLDTIVMKINGEVVEHNYDEGTSKITYNLQNLQNGQYNIQVTAKDNEGNMSVPGINKTYTVDLSDDTQAPTISNVTPIGIAKEKTDTPRISFKLDDPKSGVDKNEVKVTLDGEILNIHFDENSGYGYALPSKDLEDGKHTFTIDAKDKSGNKMATLEREFVIDEIDQPKNKDNFDITLIPDIQGFAYSEELFKQVQKINSDLAISLGDLVEEDKDEEWNIVDDLLALLRGKDFLGTPGNHEAYRGGIEKFNAKLGNSIYHMEYGNTLIISLDTSKGQSISATDPTQFEYLKEVLEKSTLNNILIVTHTPTKDSYGTKHEMAIQDAKRLEDILSNYKKQNQSKDIEVIFGHTHWLESWEKDGVNYTITGNGAKKAYVTPDMGAIHGLGNIKATEDGIEYNFDPFLTAVKIKDNAIRNHELKIGKGAIKTLNAYGDFREVDMNYIVNLSTQDKVNINWESSDKKVATIDKDGILKTLKPGQCDIVLTSGGKTDTIKLNVVNANELDIKELEIKLDSVEIRVGDKVSVSVTGIDANDTIFAISPTDVKWDIKDKDILSIDENGEFYGRQPGTTKLSYEYKGFIGELDVEVKSSNQSGAEEGFGPDGDVTPEVDTPAGEGFGPDGDVTPEVDAPAGEGFGPDGDVTPEVNAPSGEGFGPEGNITPDDNTNSEEDDFSGNINPDDENTRPEEDKESSKNEEEEKSKNPETRDSGMLAYAGVGIASLLGLLANKKYKKNK